MQAAGPTAVASFVPAVACLKGLHLVSASTLSCSVTSQWKSQHLDAQQLSRALPAVGYCHALTKLFAPCSKQLWMVAQCMARLSSNTPPTPHTLPATAP